MNVRYFPDTDTLLVTFSDRKIAETRDLTGTSWSSWMNKVGW